MPDSTQPSVQQSASRIGIMGTLLEAVHEVQEGRFEKARKMLQAVDEDLKQLILEEVREAALKLTFD